MVDVISVLPNRPIQDLKQLSVCKAEPAAFEAWLAQLPAANLGETARLLHTAIAELNRLSLPAEARLALLEKLRPVLHDILRGLSRHYLNQPLVLPPKARNVAQLAQVLQSGLALGYGLVAEEAKPAPRGGASVTGLACHRAIQEYTQVLLRSLCLYQSAPTGTWKSLHALYGLASERQQDRDSVLDPLNSSPKPLSIRQAYLRALLLACCQPHQLRQHDLRDIHQALGDWVGHADVRPLQGNDQVRVVFMDSDKPPIHRALSPFASDRLLALQAAPLVQFLRDKAGDETLEALTANGVDIPDNLLAHLAQAWGGRLPERQAVRKTVQLPVQVCFGLSAVHHHLSDGQSLDDLMGTPPAGGLVDDSAKNPFLRQQSGFQSGSDLWDSPFKMSHGDDEPGRLNLIDQQVSSRSREERSTDLQGRFPVVSLVAVDTSPDGYGFRWQGELPLALKAGEVLGLRESDQDPWQVAVIRWVKPDAQGAEFGAEVLGHHAQPWGGRAIRKTGGGSDFLRVLLLPASDDTPESLLTPRVGFLSRQKVALLQQGELRHVRLSRRLDATAAWCRFAFDGMEGLNATPSAPQAGIGFDTLWKTL